MTKVIRFLRRIFRSIKNRIWGTNYDRYMAKRRTNMSEEGRIALEVFGAYYEQEAKKLREAQLQNEMRDRQNRNVRRDRRNKKAKRDDK